MSHVPQERALSTFDNRGYVQCSIGAASLTGHRFWIQPRLHDMGLRPQAFGKARSIQDPHVFSLENGDALLDHLPNEVLHHHRRRTCVRNRNLRIQIVSKSLQIHVKLCAAGYCILRVDTRVGVRARDAAEVPGMLIDYIAAQVRIRKRDIERAFG